MGGLRQRCRRQCTRSALTGSRISSLRESGHRCLCTNPIRGTAVVQGQPLQGIPFAPTLRQKLLSFDASGKRGSTRSHGVAHRRGQGMSGCFTDYLETHMGTKHSFMASWVSLTSNQKNLVIRRVPALNSTRHRSSNELLDALPDFNDRLDLK